MLGGVVAAFSMVVIVLVSTVNAVVGQCNAQASAAPTSGPVYVSQRPSGEALADIPADYLEIYREAGEETGLDWAVIAAVGKTETDHGRLEAAGVGGGENPSGAGGPMQFLASTWASVGVDGNGDGVKDRYDPEDAIPSAANYLKLEGAPEDYRSALLAYNNAGWYVDQILAQAEDYRAAAGQQGDEMASSGALPALATLLSPLGAKPAYAAESGTVGNPEDGSYSSPEQEPPKLTNRYREENGPEPADGGEAAPMAPGPPTTSLSAYCDPFARTGLVQLVGGMIPGVGPAAVLPTGSGSATGKQVVEEAKKYLRTPYVLGGPEECVPGRQMDCTCLTTTVFRRFGYELPDIPTALMNYGEPVEGEPQAGDVLVWGDPGDGTGGHAAISLGNGQIVHANMGTMDTSVTGMYDSSSYLGARRLVDG